MTNSFDERFDRLLTAMDELGDLLAAHGDARWAEWVRRDSEKLRRHQRHGLESILSAFGGMGSLNDVVIGATDGHPMGADEVDDPNRELERLRATVYREASALLRELGEQRRDVGSPRRAADRRVGRGEG